VIELRCRIGVEKYLARMPVALADVGDIENAGCMTAAFDLKEILIGSLLHAAMMPEAYHRYLPIGAQLPCETGVEAPSVHVLQEKAI